MSEYYVHQTCQVKDLNKIYLDYFGYKTDGFFVDVGAYDGFQHSNTWGLAEAGWMGICYEPVPEYYRRCVANHTKHKVKSIETCVGNKIGIVTLNVSGTLSTYDEHQFNTPYWQKEYSNSYKSLSKITTLDKTLTENEVHTDFDVLSLDVEGAETDVLKCFDVNYWKPKMAIVEAQELHEDKELALQAPFINEYFEKAGYKKIYCDGINSIYIL